MTEKQIEAMVAPLWDFLKKDPGHKDRRQTAWGTKTKLGLALTIKRLAAGATLRECQGCGAEFEPSLDRPDEVICGRECAVDPASYPAD